MPDINSSSWVSTRTNHYMKFHLLRVKIMPVNVELVVFDPLDHKYLIFWLIFRFTSTNMT